MVPGQELPYHRYEQGDAGCYETEEEDQDNWMLLVHQIVTQPRSTACDPTICEQDIEFTERGGNVVDKEAMKKANGCVSECW